MWTLLHRRNDGSFVIQHNGYPYHVIADDPLFPEVHAAAEGTDLPPEPPPPVPNIPTAMRSSRIISVLTFRDRLTLQEEVSITEAGMTSAPIRLWLDRLSSAQELNLDDRRVAAGLEAMVTAGLLSSERVGEILS